MSEKLETMTPELKAFIEEWKSKPGNLIMVLHRVQQTYGYIPRNIAIDISQMLDVPLAKIYGVVTFYNFFRLQKAGKYNVQVCLGTTSRCASVPPATSGAATTSSRSSRRSSASASTRRPTTVSSPSRPSAASAAAASRLSLS